MNEEKGRFCMGTVGRISLKEQASQQVGMGRANRPTITTDRAVCVVLWSMITETIYDLSINANV